MVIGEKDSTRYEKTSYLILEIRSNLSFFLMHYLYSNIFNVVECRCKENLELHQVKVTGILVNLVNKIPFSHASL